METVWKVLQVVLAAWMDGWMDGSRRLQQCSDAFLTNDGEKERGRLFSQWRMRILWSYPVVPARGQGTLELSLCTEARALGLGYSEVGVVDPI